MTIEVNGTPHALEQPTLAGLLGSLGYDGAGSGIAVAVNGTLVRRAAWADHRLHDGDRVDVVGAVQGG